MKCLSTILNMIIIWHSIWRSILFCVSFPIDFFFVLFEERFFFIGNCSLRLCQKIYSSKLVIFCHIKSAYFAQFISLGNVFIVPIWWFVRKHAFMRKVFDIFSCQSCQRVFWPQNIPTLYWEFRSNLNDESIVSWCIENACIIRKFTWFSTTFCDVLLVRWHHQLCVISRTQLRAAMFMTYIRCNSCQTGTMNDIEYEEVFFVVLCWHFWCQAVNDTCNCITLIHMYFCKAEPSSCVQNYNYLMFGHL